MKTTTRLLLVSTLLATPLCAQKHEHLGRMWTLENVPVEFFDQQYGFRPTPEWLEHARLAALRFGGGCSASFVSPDGLIMTNHHCARDYVANLSPEGEDWLNEGFFAMKPEDEVKVPGLSVRQLVKTEDVTSKVKSGSTEADLVGAAKEKHPDLEHDLVPLYQGGMFQLYSYKTYDDIRLVASPPLQCAKFGGDPDNFTYPRYSLDYAFVRAYEDDKPADTAEFHFRFETRGPKEGETVFVIGNPGSTGRLQTVAQVEFMRDVMYPRQLTMVERMLGRLEEKEDKTPRDQSRILNFENTRKAFRGYLDGLRDERIMNIKREAESRVRELVAADPELNEKYGDIWTRIEEIVDEKAAALEAGDRDTFLEKQAEEEELQVKVGEAFFAVYGTEIPPDATLTLRISDGVVKGFPMNGTIAPWFTSLYGLYARYTEFGGEEPFNLPEEWIEKEDELDLSTPVNLVATCDIIGGNSGSPLIDTDLNVVGLVFDGNIQMLGNNYVFDDEVARTVCVHPAFIMESLRKVYGAKRLADELEGRSQ